MKNLSKLVMVLLMGVASNLAMAADTGVFVSADVGTAAYATFSTATAFRVSGGYNFMKIHDLVTIGAEGGLASFGSTSVWFSGTAKATGVMANAVAAWEIPHVKGLNVIGKLGLMHASNTCNNCWLGGNYSSTHNGIFYGVGLEYDIIKNLGVQATYVNYGSAWSDGYSNWGLTMLAIGATFKL